MGTDFTRQSEFLAEFAIEQPSQTRHFPRSPTCTSPTRPKSKGHAAGAAAKKVVHVDYEREEDVPDR